MFKNVNPRIVIWAIFIAVAVFIFIQAMQNES